MPEVLQFNDYDPFGKITQNRHGVLSAAEGYRYGFGGHENDPEPKGDGNFVDFGNYGLDVRIGRRWQMDPLMSQFPEQSPYMTFFNNPILLQDPTGQSPIGDGIKNAWETFISWFNPNKFSRIHVGPISAPVLVPESNNTAIQLPTASVEFKTTFGAQMTFEGKIQDTGAGVNVNVASFTIFKTSLTHNEQKRILKTESLFMTEKTDEGSDYLEINQGVSGTFGKFSMGASKEFKGLLSGGSTDSKTKVNAAFNVSPLVSGNVAISKDNKNVKETSVSVASGKVALGLGVEFEVKNSITE